MSCPFRIANTGVPLRAGYLVEAIITMLADDHAVEQSVRGFVETLARGAIHMGMSTVSVALSKRLAEVHAAHGQTYVASPVFGRPEAAAAAKLWVVAAGALDSLERCRPFSMPSAGVAPSWAPTHRLLTYSNSPVIS